MLSDMRSLYY